MKNTESQKFSAKWKIIENIGFVTQNKYLRNSLFLRHFKVKFMIKISHQTR